MLSHWRSNNLNNSVKKTEAQISIKCILLYIYKTTRVQKLVHRHFFSCFFFGRSILCKFLSHNCSKQSLDESREEESRGDLEGLQSHFTACLSSTRVGVRETAKKNRETFLRSPWSPLVLACPDPPSPQPTNTLCASLWSVVDFCFVFCHHNNRVQQ